MFTSFQKMLDGTFNETHADVANFLIQNPGNFRFTTTIEANALTFSFKPSPLPLPIKHDDAHYFCSPSYLPVAWDDTPSRQDSIVMPFTEYIPAFYSEMRVQFVDSDPEHFLSEEPTRETLAYDAVTTQDLEDEELRPANGDGECLYFFLNSSNSQRLHRPLTINSNLDNVPFEPVLPREYGPGDPVNDRLTPKRDSPGGGLTDTQNSTMTPSPAPSDSRPTVLHPALDAEPLLAMETLMPPNTYIQVSDHLSSAFSSKAPIQNCDSGPQNINSSILNTSLEGTLSHIPLIAIIQDTQNTSDSDSVDIYTTPPYSNLNTSSIASTPEPNTHDTTYSDSCPPFVDFVQAHAASHMSHKPSMMSNKSEGEHLQTFSFEDTLITILKHAGLLEHSVGNVPPATEPSDSNETCDVYFLHHSPLREPPQYLKPSTPLSSSVFLHTPPNSKASLTNATEYMPSLMPSHPFDPVSE